MKLLHSIALRMLVVAAVLFAFTGGASAQVTNLGVTVFASAARNATPVNSADQTNCCWKGALVIIDVTAFTAGTYTPSIQGKDPVSGKYYTLLTGAAIGGTGTTVLKVYPGITVQANLSVSDVLPRTWRVVLTGAAGQSMTLSVGAVLLP